MGNFMHFHMDTNENTLYLRTEKMNIEIRKSFFKFQCDNLLF